MKEKSNCMAADCCCLSWPKPAAGRGSGKSGSACRANGDASDLSNTLVYAGENEAPSIRCSAPMMMKLWSWYFPA